LEKKKKFGSYIPAKILNKKAPDKVIKYYESRLIFQLLDPSLHPILQTPQPTLRQKAFQKHLLLQLTNFEKTTNEKQNKKQKTQQNPSTDISFNIKEQTQDLNSNDIPPKHDNASNE